jgi:histidinol-phosphate/aromatic aminotransferase/cobyric acid decarboxylase-like protein
MGAPAVANPHGIPARNIARRRGTSPTTSFDVSHPEPAAAILCAMSATIMRGLSRQTPACYHGGAFFEAVGEEFDALERLSTIISADVLDAWFPPAPSVVDAIQSHLPLLLRTSPPTSCAGLVRAIARARGVEPANILAGGGSSDLIFLALTRWLRPRSRVLILDPMYGEYAHVLEEVIGCRVDRLTLSRADGYVLDPGRLVDRLRGARYDLAIVVNPNSPTGRQVSRAALEDAIDVVPTQTRVWIDETYVDFGGRDESLEVFASMRENVVVCKSMSKAYALSGVRAGYLCASASTIAGLRGYNPPWAVGLVGQVAAVAALGDPDYYESQWMSTHCLRRELGRGLSRLGIDVVPGVANFSLCHLPPDGPNAREVVAAARERGLFLREVGQMGRSLGAHAFRIAVKDGATNARMLRILAQVL